MKYSFIAEHTQEFGVERMCHVLGVQRSGYYAWLKRKPSARAQANQELLRQIRQEHQKSRQTYGSPRIHVVLRRKGIVCGHNRVARLMRLDKITGKKVHVAHPITTRQQPGDIPAPNILNQQFHATAPNRKWVCDFTYIATAQGWLFLAVVLDLFSRRVVGWSMSEQMDTGFILAAWQMAYLSRYPAPGLLHHSDRGSQYTSTVYISALTLAQVQPSMSRTGNCYDNAVVESFFSTLKAECASTPFDTRAQARSAIFEYIEIFYNRQRLHSYLGYLSPMEFERLPGL